MRRAAPAPVPPAHSGPRAAAGVTRQPPPPPTGTRVAALSGRPRFQGESSARTLANRPRATALSPVRPPTGCAPPPRAVRRGSRWGRLRGAGSGNGRHVNGRGPLRGKLALLQVRLAAAGRPGAWGGRRAAPAAGSRSYKCGFRATAPGTKSDLLPETIASPRGSVPPPLFTSRRRCSARAVPAHGPPSRSPADYTLLPRGLCQEFPLRNLLLPPPNPPLAVILGALLEAGEHRPSSDQPVPKRRPPPSLPSPGCCLFIPRSTLNNLLLICLFP